MNTPAPDNTYPAEYEHAITLPDGAPVLLRPIRPEDEPRWHEMLARCSPQSIHHRFFSMFKRTTPEMGRRYCVIDYAREIAIVAEVDEGGQKQLVGVGRLVAEGDGPTAEYAVLIIDQWQGRRLGTMLTEYCMEVARRRGTTLIRALTLADNARMIDLFRRLGFRLHRLHEKGFVLCEIADHP